MGKDTISVRLLQEALLGFTRSGQSAEALLAELGFAQLPLHQPDERISVTHNSALWLRLPAEHDGEFFGMGPRTLRVDSFSFPCRTGISQPTVGQVLTHILTFLGMMLEDFRGRPTRSRSLAE